MSHRGMSKILFKKSLGKTYFYVERADYIHPFKQDWKNYCVEFGCPWFRFSLDTKWLPR